MAAVVAEQPDPAVWTPVHIGPARDGSVVHWCAMRGTSFVDPTFAQTVDRCARHPFNRLFGLRSRLADLRDDLPALPLAGLVHHVSRCGSTLVAAAARVVPGCLALVEPGPLDTVLRDPGVPRGSAEHLRRVRATYAAVAQPRGRPAERFCVVKLDAWALHRADVLRDAFPGVPRVVLVRDPVEVVMSHLRAGGAHTVAGVLPDADLGLAAHEGRGSAAERCAAVLGAALRVAVDEAARDRDLLVVDHAELRTGGVERVLDHVGLPLDTGSRAALAQVLQRDAKNPVLPFVDDAAAKQARAGAPVRDAVRRHAREPYAALLSLARAQGTAR